MAGIPNGQKSNTGKHWKNISVETRMLLRLPLMFWPEWITPPLKYPPEPLPLTWLRSPAMESAEISNGWPLDGPQLQPFPLAIARGWPGLRSRLLFTFKTDIMSRGQTVKIKSTGQIAKVAFIRKYTEYSNSYALIDLEGKPIWNGDFRMFSEDHISPIDQTTP